MRLYSKSFAAMLMGLALVAFQFNSDAQSRGGSQSSRNSRTSASASRPSSAASRQDNKPKADISPADRNPSKPSGNVSRPSGNISGSQKPSGNQGPAVNQKPSGGQKPSGNVSGPSGSNKPSGNVSRPSENHKPSGNVSRPSGNSPRPSVTAPRPSERPHKPSATAGRPQKPSGPGPMVRPDHKPQNHWKPYGHFYGHRLKTLPPRARQYVYSGRTYYMLDDIWYRLHNGYYVVSRPPFGTVLAANLIADIVWTAVKFANNAAPQASYFYQDGVFYTLGADGLYYVIVPPAGALVERLPEDYDLVILDGYEYYRVDDTIYRLTTYNGLPYFEVVGQI